MATAAERVSRREAPYATAVGLNGSDLLTIFIKGDSGVGRCGSVQRWRSVVGTLPRGQWVENGTLVIRCWRKDRCQRCDGIHRQVKRWRGGAGVTRRIGGVEGDGVQPFTERRARGKGPVPLSVHHGGANFSAIHNHMNRRTDFTRAVEGWARIVGAVTGEERPGDRPDIVNDSRYNRRVRACGIHGEGEYRRVSRDVAYGIRGVDANVIVAIAKRSARRKGPVAVAVYRGGTNLHPIIQNVDCTAQRTCPAQRRRIVVGDLAGGQITGHAARHVVVNRIERRHRWRRQVDVNAPGVGGLAHVALRIGGFDGEGVRAFHEGGFRRKGPCAGDAVCCHDTDLRCAIINNDDTARFRRPGQGWRGVVGWRTVRYYGRGIPRVVGHAGDHRRRGDGVNGDGDARRESARVARRIGGPDRQGMIAISQRWRGVGPCARCADDHAA